MVQFPVKSITGSGLMLIRCDRWVWALVLPRLNFWLLYTWFNNKDGFPETCGWVSLYFYRIFRYSYIAWVSFLFIVNIHSRYWGFNIYCVYIFITARASCIVLISETGWHLKSNYIILMVLPTRNNLIINILNTHVCFVISGWALFPTTWSGCLNLLVRLSFTIKTIYFILVRCQIM